MDLREGQVLDGWLLQGFLGEGGNAEVWRCSLGSDVAAVKFLKTRNVESRAWARFVAEVKFLRSLGERPGVLQVLEFSLPAEGPAKGQRAWYSMPVAIPLAAGLSDAPLATVVEAVQNVADTLAALLDEHHASHRDIKPGNLYLFESQYCIGDWGLLWAEEFAGRTAAGEITGPFSFTAPQLFRALNQGEFVDYPASDVFSLAKTLWALARGSQWALPGQHQLEDAVGAFRSHPRSPTLDRLLVRATDPDPARRPTMREFADELGAWLKLSTGAGPSPSFADIGELIRDRFAPMEQRARAQAEISRHFQHLVEHAEQQLASFYNELDRSIPGIGIRLSSGVDLLDTLRGSEYLGGSGKVYSFGTAARVTDRADVGELVLEMGMVIEVWDDNTTSVGGGFFLGRVDQLGGGGSDVRQPERLITGTVAEIEAIDNLVSWLVTNAARWLQQFAEGARS